MQQHYAAVDIGATITTVSVSSLHGILARVYQLIRKTGDIRAVPRQIDFLIRTTCEQANVDAGAFRRFRDGDPQAVDLIRRVARIMAPGAGHRRAGSGQYLKGEER
jgi:hypothetical protein